MFRVIQASALHIEYLLSGKFSKDLCFFHLYTVQIKVVAMVLFPKVLSYTIVEFMYCC